MRLSPMIVQALVYKTKSNLLQLPHIEEGHLRHFNTKKVFFFFVAFIKINLSLITLSFIKIKTEKHCEY